ncbi:hypothetical protein CQ14_06560 [Bradyrhizobium lablabi]|uniref:Uncharacterized protein n=1 Tax=Bradyrhizobium lablabi TaxID=722472 RepID=A0A0R3MMA5_9BRAD|nr:hypothetical protein [Bradyrhizobium lablabi]KRR21305.1 hypothetical protein CQ14_06560 [Bradyrhizobium lablabi]
MARIEYATHDSIVSGKLQDLERTVVFFSIGSADDLSRKALATAVMSWQALKVQPSTAITVHFGGYDEDPRELWQIPEAREFIRKFAVKTNAHKHPALEPTSRALLLACGADPTKRVRVSMITENEALEESTRFFKSRIEKE